MRASLRARRAGEHGVAAVWMAIMLTTLVLFLGMGADLGMWYFNGWKQQQAADQAALAGAVFLPDDPAGAVAAAKASAAQNGFGSNVQVTVGTNKNANQINVSLDRTYGSFFARIKGKTKQNILRTSTAEYIPPLSLGSPFARLGNDPEDAGPSFNYWLSQHGPWVPKHQGDRYAADNCVADGSVNHPTPYGCTNSVVGRGANTDYARLGKYGYRYSVDVSAVQAGKDLVFEVFDGVAANTGNLCNWGNLPNPTQRAALAAFVPDADLRYRAGTEANGMKWCSGDATNISNPYDASRDQQYMDTEFAVYSPSRGVATGALVQNTVPPPTTAPAVTTTIGPGGGGSVAGPCSPATTTGPTTLNVFDDRPTSLKIYLVNTSCTETFVANGPANGTATINTYAGYRYRWYDATSGEYVGEYTVPTPPSSGYAHRSLMSASAVGSWATAGLLNPTVTLGALILDKNAATFEVQPAANGQVGCVTFATTEATPRYLSFNGIGSILTQPTSLPNATAKTNASWCPTTTASGNPWTRFASAAAPTAYLWREPLLGNLGANTTAANYLDLEWRVNLPLVAQAGEALPTGVTTSITVDGSNNCLESNGTAVGSFINMQNCASNPTQRFVLQPGTGSNVKIQGSASSLYVRPAASGTANGTKLQLEALASNSADEWTPTALNGAQMTLTSPASNRYASGNCGFLGATVVLTNTSYTALCDPFRLELTGTIAPVPLGAGPQTINLVAHLNNTGACSVAGAPATLTIFNTRSSAVGAYALDANCDETFLGEVAASGSAAFTGLKVGQRVRIYDVSMNRLGADVTVLSASHSYTLPTTGPGLPCTASTGAAASATFINQRVAPIRVFAIDSSCHVINVVTLGTTQSWTASSLAGTVWRTVDTYTGKTLRNVTLVAGSQTITEVPDVLTSGNCSPATGAATSLTIVNHRSTTLDLFSVDDSCREISRGTLAPGASTSVSSFLDERWKIYDAGSLANDTTIDSDPQTITIEPANAWVWDPNAGQQVGSQLICSRVETSYPLTNYTAADPHSGTVVQLINPRDGIHDDANGNRDTYAENFALGFRRWRQFCKIPAADVKPGRYTLTVKTNLNDATAGNNSFSLRTAWQDPVTPTNRTETGLRLSALENFPVYINLGGASTSTLYLTRIRPVHAGRQLRIELFDIGDTSSGTVNVQVIPPPDANVGASWPCTMKLVSADGTFNPPSSNAANCSVNGLTRADYNGAAVQFTIPIPPNFTCDESVATNCWTQVVLTFSGGQPTDRTTWSATVLGDPLRIVR